jgi:hypothetical protein
MSKPIENTIGQATEKTWDVWTKPATPVLPTDLYDKECVKQLSEFCNITSDWTEGSIDDPAVIAATAPSAFPEHTKSHTFEDGPPYRPTSEVDVERIVARELKKELDIIKKSYAKLISVQDFNVNRRLNEIEEKFQSDLELITNKVVAAFKHIGHPLSGMVPKI